jgi:hypothetical protein
MVGAVVIAIILCSVAALNVVATVMALRSDFGTPLQKTLQLVLVWLVPLVGSMLVVWVATSMRSDHKPRILSDASGEAWDSGMGVGSSDGRHDSHGDTSSDGGHGGH